MSRKVGRSRQPEIGDDGKALHQIAAAQRDNSLEARETARLQEELEGLLEEIRHAPTRNDKRALHEIMRSKQAQHDAHMKRIRSEYERQGVSFQREHQASGTMQKQQTGMISQQQRPHEDKKRVREEDATPFPETAGGRHWGRGHMERLREKARRQREKARRKRAKAEKKARIKEVESNVAEFERAVKKRRKEERLERKRREEEEAGEIQPAEEEHPRQKPWPEPWENIQEIRSTMRDPRNSSTFHHTGDIFIRQQNSHYWHDTSQENHYPGVTNNFYNTSGIDYINTNGERIHFDNIRSVKVDASGVTVNGIPYAFPGDTGSNT